MVANSPLQVQFRSFVKGHTSPELRTRVRQVLNLLTFHADRAKTIFNDRSPLRLKFTLTNYRGDDSVQGVETPRLSFSEPMQDPDYDLLVAERLIQSWQRSSTRHGDVLGAGAVWQYRPLDTYGEMSELIARNDPRALAELLSPLFRTKLTSGMGMGDYEYQAVRKDPAGYALTWHDRAISLAVAVGESSLQCPEAGAFDTALRADSRMALRSVHNHCGDSVIRFPQIGGCFGVEVDGEVIPLNYLQQLYAAWRMRTLMGGQPWDGLEIGGGFGGLAYAAAQFGARRYTIIDLPQVNVLQGWFLLHSDVRDRVVLFGEDAQGRQDPIHIACGGAIRDLPDRSYDIVVNQDSLPEMTQATAREYLRHTSRIARRFFLSLNQEHQAWGADRTPQNWVHALCRAEPDFELALFGRHPYWVRAGYVEELYVRW